MPIIKHLAPYDPCDALSHCIVRLSRRDESLTLLCGIVMCDPSDLTGAPTPGASPHGEGKVRTPHLYKYKKKFYYPTYG